MRSPRCLLLAAVAGAAALLLPLTPPAPVAAAGAVGSDPGAPAAVADQVDVAPPVIDWGQCGSPGRHGAGDHEGEVLECAVVDLPLDYDEPTGATTPVHVLRVPATGERIGSLFVNPGGPGGSATEFAAYAHDELGPEVVERFDIVGVEPRGVGANPAARCRVPDRVWRLYPRIPYPVTDRQERRWLLADRRFNEACAGTRSPVTDHLSTADVARDMDVVRQALGDEQLSYYGISYGSVLGQTYAALFPDRVRAVVVDGVLDPVAWTTGRDPSRPMTFRLRSGEGAYEALVSALNECDRVGPRRCAVAGRAHETWHRVRRAASRGELVVRRERIGLQDLVQNALGSLYDAWSLQYLMRFLDEADRALRRSEPAAAAVSSWEVLERARAEQEEVGPYGWTDGAAPVARVGGRGYGPARVDFPAVLCSDSVNPAHGRAWRVAGSVADRTQPWFGRSWTWRSSLCADWTGPGGEDAFRGPWATRTSTPLLVIGNTHDPATPIRGARAANRLFAGSVLLTLDAWGHGAFGTSPCISKRVTAYLLEQRLPRPSVVCDPAEPLFPLRGDGA